MIYWICKQTEQYLQIDGERIELSINKQFPYKQLMKSLMAGDGDDITYTCLHISIEIAIKCPNLHHRHYYEPLKSLVCKNCGEFLVERKHPMEYDSKLMILMSKTAFEVLDVHCIKDESGLKYLFNSDECRKIYEYAKSNYIQVCEYELLDKEMKMVEI